jgi:DNA-directed RNA polymerase subunit K/omega
MAETRAVITKYEYARLMAARVTELSKNAQPRVQAKTSESILSPLQVAEAEFAAGVLPLKLVRRTVSGSTESCNVERLTLLPAAMSGSR